MKLAILFFLISGLMVVGSLGQTIKNLGYNTTNGSVVYFGTNALDFTNRPNFSGGITVLGSASFGDDIFASYIEFASGTNFTEIRPTGFSFGGIAAVTTRSNLSLSASWLTNTSASDFRSAIGVPTSLGFGTNSIIGIAGNTVFGNYSVVSGGFNNISSFGSSHYSFIGGGAGNVSSSQYSVVVGGGENTVNTNDSFSFVGGGERNHISNSAGGSVIVGGRQNTNRGYQSFIGGGTENLITNGLNSQGASILGGILNIASGASATVAGGSQNEARGFGSFAAGMKAKATNAGSFVWAEGGEFDFNFSSTNDNSFNVRARGGMSLELGGNGIIFRSNSDASATRLNLGLGNGTTSTKTFVSYDGTNYTTNIVTISNGIITSWMQ